MASNNSNLTASKSRKGKAKKVGKGDQKQASTSRNVIEEKLDSHSGKLNIEALYNLTVCPDNLKSFIVSAAYSILSNSKLTVTVAVDDCSQQRSHSSREQSFTATDVLPTLAGAVKASNMLPAGEQFNFYSSFPQFAELMKAESSRSLQLVQNVLKYAGVRSQVASRSSDMELEDRVDALVAANDELIERIANSLDEEAGLKKPQTVSENEIVVATRSVVTTRSASWNTKKVDDSQSPALHKLLGSRFVQRPQACFKEKIDNTDRPFEPKLSVKPNAVVSLEDSLKLNDSLENGSRPNPYKPELDALVYTEDQLKIVENPEKPSGFSESPDLKYIDMPEQLDLMLDDLRKVKEIAVDLEAHSYRTFQGLTCLMQLSTRTQDYVIDTLKLRSELVLLNEIFTDPTVVKVFHGADSDIAWLQRDLGLYIVNMFDTHQACSTLGDFPRNTLAYLLQRFCDVKANKQYQMADWRIRPLPKQLLLYAREDTHYLLYIYDVLKNTLIERGNVNNNLLVAVLNRSKEICTQVYVKPTIDESKIMKILSRSKTHLNHRQMYAMRKLYEWRFRLAQQEDESMSYVMPNHILLQISNVLPREPSGVLACCTPIPPLVRQSLLDIHALVHEAREQPMHPPATASKPSADNTQQLANEEDEEEEGSSRRIIRPQQPANGSLRLPSLQFFNTTSRKLVNVLEKVKEGVSKEVLGKVNQIKESFINPLANYTPIPFIDYTQKRTKNPELKPELKREAVPSLEQPAVKKAKIEDTGEIEEENEMEEAGTSYTQSENMAHQQRAAQVELAVSEELQKLRAESSGSGQKTKKKKKSDNSPMRDRRAVNPQTSKKKFSIPEEGFEAYDYSQVDYSEFVPPKPKNIRKQQRRYMKGGRAKDLKDQKYRPDGMKRSTFGKKK